ncbi:hypothetical protein [Bradyrhizobium roseum]|uniref:hypothetical protein n=1 Tax=Bradyrhizobium roseum TaxID=3056648 RepID=UPI002614EC2D|nr:hypothetical protein [Bradyrhizobium roseus]WKA30558.1 hypothetical protein QUH67_10490 [Bradyrhizobium roseus]
MNAPVAALLLICLLAAPARCPAQESADSNLSQEEWRQRVDQARRRTDDFVATARSRKADSFSADDLKKEAIDRARRDPTLRQGDIVATDRGFEMFVGNEEYRQPGDFVAVQGSK